MKFPKGNLVKVIRARRPGGWLRVALGLGLLSGGLLAARACISVFTSDLLGGGDARLLAAPDASFRSELEAMQLPLGKFTHLPPPDLDYAEQRLEAEMAELTAALRKVKVPDADAVLTVAAYRKQRQAFDDYRVWVRLWQRAQPPADPYDFRPPLTITNAPEPPELSAIPGLPAEFADYFTGAIAWQLLTPDTNTARQAWGHLLERPAAERKFKSTWAAYMLGKSWEAEDPEQAVSFYRQTRELARRGFSDRTGLAAASLGREALVELRRHHYAAALSLYLDQYASGNDSGVESLRTAAAAAFNDPETDLVELAKSPRLRAVMTTYLISSTVSWYDPEPRAETTTAAKRWLKAIEAVRITEVKDAERLALAAYQSGEYEIAAGWAKRAGSSTVGQWLQAKLLLREGQVTPAAKILSRLSHQLPLSSRNRTNHTDLLDSLIVPVRNGLAQVHGDWATLALTQGDYTEALDTLFRCGFWEDAAYVAERVFTTGELKNYVDQNWPESSTTNANVSEAEATDRFDYFDWYSPKPDPSKLRYLLARRLTRESRGREATPYFPVVWQKPLAALLTALDGAANSTAPATVRAQHFYTAAWLARTNGIELLGTELAPDWFINDGQFDSGLTWQLRATNNQTAIANIASEDELNRAAQHRTDPDKRFHYRYQAALLAWEAAKLLPDNTDETARILCTAGSWLKDRDPDTADLFYKTLVRRCRKTAIGAQADEMRWFPVLDENGNPKPYVRQPKTTEPEPVLEEMTEPIEEEFDPSIEVLPSN